MVQDLAKTIIKEAVSVNAQDIYMIPKGERYELYIRVGAERKKLDCFEPSHMFSIISHFKFVAGMNVGEKRRSQLGSCDYVFGEGKEISLRLSSVGDYRGRESLVIRLLYPGIYRTNYWFDNLERLQTNVGSRGLYLFSGPVGSGKTTLMYQLATEKFQNKQIISIEDPVEIKDETMLQLQINESIGMTYDHLIKLSLRHRPDILIVGEIRDETTAHAAIRASLTGIVVFSTIHAKSIAGVYDRLEELGVSQGELSSCLQLIAYQRLIGGGGVIDFAAENFQNHVPDSWNKQIDRLVKGGYITKEEARLEKIKA
ncbi:type II/IV secretion system protein [Streptococcus chenjunshii]|uniref:Type II/IV secretion system protein n=1 Tax=Streptococcus chenjunshii TaxID=2173853 RepID=A0A372KL41_9STRE|nr:competence type IV pilus ATPase ComGA [Streptococcus chenjunshii]AXQ77707.1 type II/IV secretion system protein [Streptococcus chenjunshii]RFU50851.1 type II/IV secretion system protein [Streptococcus chenjunshii]RFU52997.1 type II/IV secretion system protein [Streptococcus chenjunshii]